MGQKAGRITAAGMTKEVTFEPVDGPINDLVDEAYRAKYRGSPYLGPIISARARSATVKIMPPDVMPDRPADSVSTFGTATRRGQEL